MKKVRVLIKSGEYENKVGVMDSCGWITFSDISDTIHNSQIKWEFYDFRDNQYD